MAAGWLQVSVLLCKPPQPSVCVTAWHAASAAPHLLYGGWAPFPVLLLELYVAATANRVQHVLSSFPALLLLFEMRKPSEVTNFVGALQHLYHGWGLTSHQPVQHFVPFP